MTTQLSPELAAAASQQVKALMNAGADRSTASMLVVAFMMEKLVEVAKQNEMTVAEANEMQRSMLGQVLATSRANA